MMSSCTGASAPSQQNAPSGDTAAGVTVGADGLREAPDFSAQFRRPTFAAYVKFVIFVIC